MTSKNPVKVVLTASVAVAFSSASHADQKSSAPMDTSQRWQVIAAAHKAGNLEIVGARRSTVSGFVVSQFRNVDSPFGNGGR